MKKQLFLKICAVAAISISVFSCKKDAVLTKPTLSTTASNQAFNGGSDVVYVGGLYIFTTQPLARYWTNTTTVTNLTNGTSTNGHAYDIAVNSGGDIFVVGTDGTGTIQPGVVWKNGVETALPKATLTDHVEPRMVYADAASGNIYIAGISWNSTGSVKTATYWTIPSGNTSLISVSKFTLNPGSDAFGVTKTSAGVYVVGTDVVGGIPSTVVYWDPSSAEHAVAATGARPQIASIGTDVYIAAASTTGTSASMLFFKNGASYSPGITGGPTVSISNWSLVANGTDLYIEYAGTTMPSATQVTIWVWKNSTLQYTISGSGGQFGTDFHCLGVGPSGHTYVAGTDSFVGCYWDNGIKNTLFGGTNNNITGIAVH